MAKAFFLIFLFWFECTIGQVPCHTSDIIFTRQSQLDSFNILFPGCTHATNIEIFGQNIESVKALSNLTIANEVHIANTSIKNLSGLHNLEESSILLTKNDLLTNIKDIKNIKKAVVFAIHGNEKLQNFEGINCDTIKKLVLTGNILAKNLKGVNCKFIDVIFLENWDYDNLGQGNFNVNVMFLSEVDNIDSLSMISGLKKLEIVFSNLTNIDEVKNLPFLERIEISLNPLLSNCASELICGKINDPNFELRVSLNKKGCNTIDEIRAACTSSQEDPQYRQINISPNPTDNELTIKGFKLGSEITAYDVNGHVVIKQVLHTQTTILDVSNLNAGMYFLKIEQPSMNEYSIYKIVKL